jgi:hypothetical protein
VDPRVHGRQLRVSSQPVELMRPAARKSIALAAFILLILSLLVTLVRPRVPGSHASRAELMSIPIQIVLAILAFRQYRQ